MSINTNERCHCLKCNEEFKPWTADLEVIPCVESGHQRYWSKSRNRFLTDDEINQLQTEEA